MGKKKIETIAYKNILDYIFQDRNRGLLSYHYSIIDSCGEEYITIIERNGKRSRKGLRKALNAIFEEFRPFVENRCIGLNLTDSEIDRITKKYVHSMVF